MCERTHDTAADLLAFPSLWDGFGWPALEAMASEVPVVTSNRGSLPEVVGDAAIMVNPHKINEIASAINRVLENKQLQEDLRQKGYTRAAHFTWVRSAQKMLSIYTQLYEGKTQFNDEVEEFL